VVQGFLNKALFNKKRLIMIADDSPVIRQIVKEGLEDSGYQVITAINGKRAIKMLDKKSPDLIVSDIEMPEMNGFELCKWIKSNSKTAFIPFIVMSSKNDAFYTRRMIQHGAAAYIHKPFNVDQLIILIEKILTDQYHLLLKEKERLDLERGMIIASITSLATALEARDPYTRGHSESVARIVSGMLSLTNPNPEDMEPVLIGSKLHDIGKIGIRDKILHKPGPLTYKEFTHIKKHPLIGANILSSITTLKKALCIILSHHERLDGKGYPEGLKGDKIPFWARMTAVADTYDALTSDRPYRKGMSKEKALQIIEDVSGSQLCPDCVELFFKWVDLENEGKLQKQVDLSLHSDSVYESIQAL
jgi:response regulator RpfG family c-di-GMP phosphodiesterase